MTIRVGVVREARPDEARVALVPDSVRKLRQAQVAVSVEQGAGEAAGFSDADYVGAGATVEPERKAVLTGASILAAVGRPPDADIERLSPSSGLIGFLRPLDEPAALHAMIERGLTAFAMELIPRTARAQAMDALSSMATVVGYKAVIVAASRLPRMFPLLMTAAGTVPPARVLVVGAGVAGLQAIATARRLGAVVEAYDVRPAAGEEVRSLGATFLDVDLGGISTQDAGGYAVELSEEALSRGRARIAERARQADVVITTAQVPGKRAPLMLTAEAVGGMKRGALVLDLAASTGGNCALTKPGQKLSVSGVEILAPLDLAASVPGHASQLYSRNVSAFLGLLVKDGGRNIDLQDDILGPACVSHAGKVMNPRLAALLGQPVPKGA